MKVYDGMSNESALIGTYCGQQRNLVLYSSESNLFVSFETIPRTANTQNRGFKGIFEFSESFVKLGKYHFANDSFIIPLPGINYTNTVNQFNIYIPQKGNDSSFSPNRHDARLWEKWRMANAHREDYYFESNVNKEVMSIVHGHEWLIIAYSTLETDDFLIKTENIYAPCILLSSRMQGC